MSNDLQARSQDYQNEEADRSSGPSPSLPSAPLPFDVAPLNPARGSVDRCKLPQRGLGRSRSRNPFWCTLALKSGISGGNNFNDCPENQLTKFGAL